jgi:beta propeller repeat protein
MTASRLDAEIDIFKGVIGWVQLGGVPSSPTSAAGATIFVGGENVDYYRYRVGIGSWSAETPVSEPLELTGLSAGTVDLYVKGRSRYGGYLPDENAVHASWVVDPDAPATKISGVPLTPSRVADATLWVSGVDLYRYTVDSGYYRPEAPASQPIAISGLADGHHVASVIGKQTGGEWQLEAEATTVSWAVERRYGYDFSSLQKVFSTDFDDVGAQLVSFSWDGRDGTGAVLPPGWYTVRLTVMDELGRSACRVKLIQVGDLMPDGVEVWDGSAASQKNADAFGGWAVWQDQRSGSWDVYAWNFTDGGSLPALIAQGPLNQERPRTDGRYAVWEDRQPDGNWDIWGLELGGAGTAFAVTETADLDEQKPVVYWPWVVYQTKLRNDPDAAWQLVAYNLETETAAPVDPTTQDQLDASIYRGKVVWQDFRDPGYGEIYFKDLRTGEERRLTDDPYSQYHPSVFENWVVWSDKRNVQSDLYGYNLLRRTEARLTETPENETRPFVSGKWVVYEEDSAGVSQTNVRILHLSNLARINLTNYGSLKERPVLASGKVFWQDERSGRSTIMAGSLPDLQAVFDNYNAVAVTEGMVSRQKDAFTLLSTWNVQAGVSGIIRYRSLVPFPVIETAVWDNGGPVGSNFDLEEGSFLWVVFDRAKILHLGVDGECDALDLASGVNVFSYRCFPDRYTAYGLLRELGKDAVRAVRMLDSETGKWLAAAVEDGKIVGEDFQIPRIAVMMMDMKVPASSWIPGM